MDFNIGLDGDLFGASDGCLSDQKAYGSVGGLMKRGRASESLDDSFRDLPVSGASSIKMLKIDDLPGSKLMLSQTRDNPPKSNSLFPDGNLGLSSLSKADGLLNIHESVQATPLPTFNTPHAKLAGSNSASLNGNMNGVPEGFRGPFSPSQLLELEHQVLIFKCLAAGAPVPPKLLLPMRNNLRPSLPSAYPAGSLAPNHLGWGSVHVRFSGNADPEPGRCRRTDGKKWRCAREAVVDQKYCERHLNRGRHRSSRKTVEGQTGHATTRNDASSASMALPPATSPSVSSALKSPAIPQPQVKSSDSASADADFSRFSIKKSNPADQMQNLPSSSLLSSVNLEGGLFPATKQQFPYRQSSRMGIALNSSDSLLHNAQRNSYVQSSNFGLPSDLNTRSPEQGQYLHRFIDDWPKVDDVQPERTHLSTSMPAASLDFSSSSSSVKPEQVTLPPLKVVREMHPIQMGLGVGAADCSSQTQSTWAPSSWETAPGGPLAEVLNSSNTTTNTSTETKNSSALNIINHGWDAKSPLESSPTGVLQKTAFGTLSCSSAGSSPRPEAYKPHENSLPDDPFGPALVNSASITQPS